MQSAGTSAPKARCARQALGVEAKFHKGEKIMRFILAAAVAMSFAAMPTLVLADGAVVTGAAGGAVAGAVVGGPVGAAVGGVAGAMVGAAADRPVVVVGQPQQAVVVREKPTVIVTDPGCQTKTVTKQTGNATVTKQTANC
jgi:hypothetical protein